MADPHTLGLLDDVLAWSDGRPGWQRDALRRLAVVGELTDVDIAELADLAESEAAAASEATTHRVRPRAFDGPAPAPLTADHLPVVQADLPGVRLVALTAVTGVNALIPDAELEFGEGGLTVVSGWNGVGKSGYARILARVARHRAPEESVLPNVYDGSDPGEPRATIVYRLGSNGTPRRVHWREGAGSLRSATSTTESVSDPSGDPGSPPGDELARVAFFDAAVAAEHIERRVDVRYRPPGLDLLAGLAAGCRRVEGMLRRRAGDLAERGAERALLAGLAPPGTKPDPAVAAVFEALGGPLAAGEDASTTIRRLSTLSEGERDELTELRRRIGELRSSDPARSAAIATAHAGQLEVLVELLGTVATRLAPAEIDRIVEAAADVEAYELTAAAMSAERFADEPLPGVGGQEWSAMWHAARHYAVDRAGLGFPPGTGEACPLCQRPLDAVTAERLRRYQAFIASDAEDRRVERLAELDRMVADLRALPLDHPGVPATCELVRATDPRLADRIVDGLELAADLVRRLARLTETDTGADQAAPDRDALRAEVARLPLTDLADRAAVLATADRERAAELTSGVTGRAGSTADALRAAEARVVALESRLRLAEVADRVLAEHDRRIDAAVLAVAVQGCGTAPITRFASELSGSRVDDMCARFAAELERLGTEGFEVDLAADGGTRGVSYVRVTLPAAPETHVARVLSEGERRVVALAAFLAEVSAGGDGSAMVFDDPVTSLDHRYRRRVAARLVAESATRQVVVFTHDLVFVNDIATEFHQRRLELQMAGEPPPAPVTYRSVVRTAGGTGLVTADLGLRNPKVRTRLRALGSAIDAATALWDAGDEVAYERAAREILRPLREAWERAVEEILLHEVVVRHGSRVQTRRLGRLVGITAAEVAAVERGMSVESRFLHDTPVGEENPIPPPTWLRSEVEAMQTWISQVTARQRRM